MKKEIIIHNKTESYITIAADKADAKESEGKLFRYRRYIEGTFCIKAKSKEEADNILSDWDNYSMIDEVMEVDEEDISDDYNEYSMTHTVHRDDEKENK